MHWLKLVLVVGGFLLFLLSLHKWLEPEEDEENDRLPLDNFNRWRDDEDSEDQ